MDEQIALLRTIAANPEDDTPRLVYADWLDESGSELNRERAEFIRFDVRYSSLPPQSQERRQLSRKRHELMMGLARDWRNELPRIEGVTWGWFERGFIDQVSGFYSSIRDSHELILDSAPIVGLSFNSIAEVDLLQLCEQPWMERITRLELNGGSYWINGGSTNRLELTSHLADRLIDSPYLKRVRRLKLHCAIERNSNVMERLKKQFGEVRH